MSHSNLTKDQIQEIYNSVQGTLRSQRLEALYTRLDALLEVSDFIHLYDTQSEHQCPSCTRDSEIESLRARFCAKPPEAHKPEIQIEVLLTHLRRATENLTPFVEMLLAKEKKVRKQKIGVESLEQCLLHQSASLLGIVSDRVIPCLEHISRNKK